MAKRITREDREAMQSATMGCWWPQRIGRQPVFEDTCWSGIRNELELLAKQAEERAQFNGWANDEAEELARLAALAGAQIVYVYA